MKTISGCRILWGKNRGLAGFAIHLLHTVWRTGRKHAFIVVYLFLSACAAIAQNLDSLENQLKLRTLSPKEKIRICDDLSWGYSSVDYHKAVQYAQKGAVLAEQEGDKKMVATFYLNTGIAYYMASLHDSALVHLSKALQTATSIGDENLQSAIYGAYGNLYNVQGDYKKALDYYMKALPLAEKVNKPQRVRSLLGNTGSVFNSLRNYAQAEKYFRKSLKLSRELDDTSGMGQAYDGLATVLSFQNKADSAIVFERLAVEAFRKSGEKHFEAASLAGLASIYFKDSENHRLAEKYGLEALSLSEETEIPSYIANALNILSNVCLAQKRYGDCLAYAQKAIETDTTEFSIYSNLVANMALSNIYLGNKDKARTYFDKYTAMINERANENYQKSVSETEIKYETEKKELQIAALLKQKALYGAITITTLTTILLLLLIVYLRYRFVRQKKLIAEQRIINLEQEKKLIATQSILEGENAERTRLARDLHDGLGGMLSLVKLKLHKLKGNAIVPQTEIPVLQNALETLDQAIRELRHVAHNLMPESLTREGLQAALTDFCNDIPHAEIHFFGTEEALGESYKITSFRILQELVNNALKHSQATQVIVQVIIDDNRLNLIVSDNGKGFDTSKTDFSKTSGLNNLKSRVDLHAGRITIQSGPDRGTEVEIEFQLNNQSQTT
ncbi:MAG: tetratricopeptide repeat protein [Mangrovibacterium sp.]